MLDFCIYTQEQRSIKKYTKLSDNIKNQIDTINGGKPIKYKKDFIKIRFESEMIYLWIKY